MARNRLALPIPEEIGEKNAPARTDSSVWKLAFSQKFNEVGTRNLQDIGRLLRRQFGIRRDDGNSLAVSQLPQSGQKKWKNGRRHDKIGMRPVRKIQTQAKSGIRCSILFLSKQTLKREARHFRKLDRSLGKRFVF